ncbi:MAG: Chromate resistance protein ChrB [Dehalococcoidia bacterium]
MTNQPEQNQPAAHQRWVLLIYRVPTEPPGRRTYVWRQLKQLGAIYLQQAAAVLPERPELHTALNALVARIEEYTGDASLLQTTSPNLAWEQRLIGRFNEARDAEYAEVVENVERFEDEVRREDRKGRFHFAQLEDLEAELQKLEQWLERIFRRDFFGAPGRAAALAALERGEAALEAFTTEVYAHEEVDGDGHKSLAGQQDATTGSTACGG